MRACAMDRATPIKLRAAAASALGRYASTHHSVAAEVLPAILALAQPDQPLALRLSATAVFGSVVPRVPSLTEPHVASVLHRALLDKGEEQTPLRACAHAVLADLLQARKLILSSELPLLLPFVLDEALGESTLACVHRLMTHEGPLRWTRLLHGSVVQLCPTSAPEEFASMLQHLVPATIGSARLQDVAQLGEALCSQLAAEAALCLATASAEDSAAQMLHNLAHLFAAWPPSDRGLVALHRALGGEGESNASGGGATGGSALLSASRDDVAVHRCLLAHVHKAHAKHLKGSTVDAIAALLGKLDPEQPAASKGPSRRRAADEGADGELSASASKLKQRALAEQRARDALARLKSSEELYVSASLPELGQTRAPPPAAAGSSKHKRRRVI